MVLDCVTLVYVGWYAFEHKDLVVNHESRKVFLDRCVSDNVDGRLGEFFESQ